MFIALSGTPGVGKSTAGLILERRGHHVIELATLALREGVQKEYDIQRETFEVDLDNLERILPASNPTDRFLLVGHLSHLMPVEMAIVLRCRPSLLGQRLRARGYKERKVRENMEAEACDVILIESLEEVGEVYEIDASGLTPDQVADSVEQILRGETEKYGPGHIDWSEEVLSWF